MQQQVLQYPRAEPFGFYDCLAIVVACAMQIAGTILLVAELGR